MIVNDRIIAYMIIIMAESTMQLILLFGILMLLLHCFDPINNKWRK